MRYAIPDGFSLAVPSSSCVRASKRVIQSAADVVDQHLLSTRVFAYLGLTNPAVRVRVCRHWGGRGVVLCRAYGIDL